MLFVVGKIKKSKVESSCGNFNLKLNHLTENKAKYAFDWEVFELIWLSKIIFTSQNQISDVKTYDWR